MSASVRLVYGGGAIRVGSGHPAPVRWLEEFLTPWFASDKTPGHSPAADAVVTLCVDPGRLDAARHHVADAAARPDCFVLDSRVIRHPARVDDRRRWTVLDAELGVAYVVDREQSAVEILARGDEPGARVALMRVVRELVTGRVTRDGGVLMHAGALAVGERVVLVAGPKEAGKTTLLLHLLHAPGARFVANDRVVVPTGREPWARGMPSIVAVRPGTLGRLPALRARLRAGPATHWLTRAEVDARPEVGPLPCGAGADLSPAQLCAALGVAAAPDGRLAAVVFPRVEPARQGIELAPLDREPAGDRLIGARFGAAPDRRSAIFGWLEDRSGATRPRGPAATQRCRDLAARVPCFEARLGAAALDDVEAAAARLAAVGA